MYDKTLQKNPQVMVTLKGEELKRTWYKTYEDHKENQLVLGFTIFHTRLKYS